MINYARSNVKFSLLSARAIVLYPVKMRTYFFPLCPRKIHRKQRLDYLFSSIRKRDDLARE